MAKKSSLVDKALEVSRKNRVPKKPVKTKGKKTVPAVLDWGTGIPEDKLAYLNDDEMALVQAKRGFKGKREVDGVPAFPDPGDTAAGSKSGGPDRGPTGGPSRTSPSSNAGAGAGGLGGGGKGGAGGAPGGSPGAGGSKAGPSGGQTSPSGGAGGQRATPSGGPGGGPGGGSLSAPARTAPSAATSSPAGFGPRVNNAPGNVSPQTSPTRSVSSAPQVSTPPNTFGPRTSTTQNNIKPQSNNFSNPFTSSTTISPTNPVSTAPSSMDYQGALNRIAQGSSVLGNPTGQKPITDRVPQAAPQAVRYSQAPTISPNMSGPGNYSSLSSITSGANSPFADPGVTSYDAEKERDRAIASAKSAAQSGILGPSVPAGTAIQRDPYFGSEQIANRYSGSSPSIGVNATAYSAQIGPTLSQKLAADAQENIFSGSPTARSISVPAKQFTDRLPGSEAMPPGDVYKTPGPKIASGFVEEMGRNISGVGNYSQAGAPAVPSGAISIGKNISGVGNYSQAGVPSNAPVGASPNIQPASAPATSYSGNVFNKSPAQQAEDIRRAVALAQGAAPSRQQSQSDINVPGYPGAQADISPSQGDYSPSQAPAYDVSPSQQSGWTSAQRDAYLGSLGNSKTGRVTLPQTGGQPQELPVVPEAPMTTLAPLPDWVNYNYLSNNYPEFAVGVNPNIDAFNQYNATFRRGGRVGDSIEAALRLALQGIVSRNKTS